MSAAMAAKPGNLLEKLTLVQLSGGLVVETLKTVHIVSGDCGTSYHSTKSTREDVAAFGRGDSKISTDTSNCATTGIPKNAIEEMDNNYMEN